MLDFPTRADSWGPWTLIMWVSVCVYAHVCVCVWNVHVRDQTSHFPDTERCFFLCIPLASHLLGKWMSLHGRPLKSCSSFLAYGLSHVDSAVPLLGDRFPHGLTNHQIQLGYNHSHPTGLLFRPGLSWRPQHLSLFASSKTVDVANIHLPDSCLHGKHGKSKSQY